MGSTESRPTQGGNISLAAAPLAIFKQALLAAAAAVALTQSARSVQSVVATPATNYLYRLSTNASRAMAFAPANGNHAVNTLWLATNTNLWTWPVNLSCVGFAPNPDGSGGFLVLIAPRLVYFANHIAGLIGTNIIFHDARGALWIGTITNEIHFPGDMALGLLRDPAPASIVLPYILPPDAVTNFPGGSLKNVPAFWLHNNKARIESIYISATPEYAPAGMSVGDFVNVEYAAGPFAATPSSVGDSSSPLFTLYKDHLIFLGALTLGGSGLVGFGGAGSFSYISGHADFPAWQRSGLTNGVRILNQF